MNKRDMKKQIKQTVATFLVQNMRDTAPHDAPNLIAEIKLDVFRDGYTGTEAEQRRLENILYEMHREAYDYEV